MFEETKHDTNLVAKRIDRVVPAQFLLHRNGLYTVPEGQVYPFLRSFPSYPEQALEPGLIWQAFGERIVEPFRDGKYTRVRFYCEYRYQGIEQRSGADFSVVKAQYAMRYKQGQDPYGDERIKNISGKHVVTIYHDIDSDRPSFTRDQVEEHYNLADGKSITFKGFVLTWYDDIAAMNRPRLVEKIRKEIGENNLPDLEVGETEAGVSLTINKIHFVPDQAEVLRSELPRLKLVAEALKNIAARTFMVVGHTARVGSAESQDALSVARAKTIVDYLVSQGIDAKRLLYDGRGGRNPLAPSDTEENRAKNRRVEIIILED